MNSIKYVLIYSIETKSPIGQYPEQEVDEYFGEAMNVFSKCSSTKSHLKNHSSSTIREGEGAYFFTIDYSASGIYYFVFYSGYDSTEGKDIFELIEDIQGENIYLLTESLTKKLNLIGRQKLKRIVDAFNSNHKHIINDININLKETKELIKSNIKCIASNMTNIQELETKSGKLKEASSSYKNNAGKLKKATWWYKTKCTIFIVLLIICLFLAIILPIILK